MTEYTYDHTFEPNSAAIKQVFYSSDTGALFVQFHNGSIAGYSGVSIDVYTNFMFAESTGKYWNNEIYGHFDGIDTGDLRLVERKLSDVVEEEESADSVEEENSDPVTDSDQLHSFKIVASVITEVTISCEAKDLDEAMALASDKLDDMGDYKFLSATRFF